MFLGDIPARAAIRNPDKVAIVDPVRGRAITYAELEQRVSGLTSYLEVHPVRPGDRVAILAYNCIEYFEVYFAAARAGVVSQGLNWRLAVEELERVLSDSTPSVVICEGEFAAIGEALQERCSFPLLLTFGTGGDGSYERAIAAGGARRARRVSSDESDPVTIIYTGGTSGSPKGAIHTHASISAAMINNTVAERVVPTDRYLLLGQMFHSASILAVNYLGHGASVILLPKFEPTTALEVIEAERATASLAFPAMMNYVLAEAGKSHYDLTSLRNVQYGGGPIAPEVILQMMDVLPASFIQCYGTSEHVGVTFLSQEDHANAKAQGDLRRLRSCGREAYLSRVRLLDEEGREVPRDGKTVGEICVASASNMTGYWRQEAQTAAAQRGPGEQGTSDLAVWDEQGYLYVVGRSKDMIISGGENIYPAQVEIAIGRHPAVLEVAVVGSPDELWGEAVTAFVVVKDGDSVSGDEIRQAVTDGLGSYQKPRIVYFVPELPKSSSGKIAKHLLTTEEARDGLVAH